jgi:hypothetical protein
MMQAWNVYRPSHYGNLRHIDTVFYTADCDAEWVKDTLVSHDGYRPDIIVRKA